MTPSKLDQMKAEFAEWASGFNWATMDVQARAWGERRRREGRIRAQETRERKAARAAEGGRI